MQFEALPQTSAIIRASQRVGICLSIRLFPEMQSLLDGVKAPDILKIKKDNLIANLTISRANPFWISP
jgi:hypothetical protein